MMVPRHGIAVHSAEYVGSDAAAKKKTFQWLLSLVLKKKICSAAEVA